MPLQEQRGKYYYGPERVRMNNGVKSAPTHKTKAGTVWDKGGQALCFKRAKSFKTSDIWNGYNIQRVHVTGKMTGKEIFKACELKKMRPVCNSIAVSDGRCVAITGDKHVSLRKAGHMQGHKDAVGHEIVPSVLQGAFTYMGPGAVLAMMDTAGSHKRATRTAMNGDTLCVEVNRGDMSFSFNDYLFKRIKVTGEMNSKNILEACADNKARPVCEFAGYADGQCRIAGGNWHFAVTKDQKTFKLPIKKIRGAYFYTGKANKGLSLMATGLSKPDHKWSTKGKDMDGDTFCVTRAASFKAVSVFDGHKLERVAVSGRMTSKNIRKACHKKGLKPVCNHAKYADGRCVLVGGNWHFSKAKHTASKTDPLGVKLGRSMLQGVFTYCGNAFKGQSLVDLASKHRVSTDDDKGGDTLCTSTNYTNAQFTYNDYKFKRVPVHGAMVSKNIDAACRKLKMRPLCDIGTAGDGACRIAGGDNWHFSHPKEVAKNIPDRPQRIFRGAYFYSGSATKGGLASMNAGDKHRWAKDNVDKDGDTFCVKKAKTFKNSFKWNGHTMERVELDADKVMTSRNIVQACAKKGMRPVCNNAVFADGTCIIVGGEWHMSKPGSNAKELPRILLRGTFTYCGKGDGPQGCNGWSYLDTGHNHRLSRHTDKGGDTLCIAPQRQRNTFMLGKYQFSRVKVKGFMTSPNILTTCKKLNMKPACDRKAFNDGKCMAVGDTWLSFPESVKQNKMLKNDHLKGAYFYCGTKNGGRTLLNTGSKHVWSVPKRDKDGDTFCVRHASEIGHGKCNCPSVNYLMNRAHEVKVECLAKKADKLKKLRAAQKTGDAAKVAAIKNAEKAKEESRELGEDDSDEGRVRMARIVWEATPKTRQPELGESSSALEAVMSDECKGKCGDVRGLVREIYERERDCGLLNRDVMVPIKKVAKLESEAGKDQIEAKKLEKKDEAKKEKVKAELKALEAKPKAKVAPKEE